MSKKSGKKKGHKRKCKKEYTTNIDFYVRSVCPACGALNIVPLQLSPELCDLIDKDYEGYIKKYCSNHFCNICNTKLIIK